MSLTVSRSTFGAARLASAPLGLVLLLSGCTGIDAQAIVPAPAIIRPALSADGPSPSEIAYVEQTASMVYRRAPVERMNRFLFSDARGHGICVRSRAGSPETSDYTLLVLQRRIQSDVISQVEDDVAILRSAADAAPCRALGADPSLWVRAG